MSPSPLARPAPAATTSPVICVVGGHNSDDYGTSRILLHTPSDFKEQERGFGRTGFHAVKPLLVAGLKLRVAKAQQAFMELADACEYPIAIIVSAKGQYLMTIAVQTLIAFQDVLNGESNDITETGDSWFNCQKHCLPEKCGCGFQMQYGSIGCSRCINYDPARKRSIVFIIKNGGYTIRAEIHDGPYNVIKNQNYTGVVGAINRGEGKCCNCKVKTEEEFK
ncbi:hypothetical protein OPV22_033765 [Ensete ventricosum]|uniref:Expansin-like EG45 domain-containing protein n=1 Tax=Ensete ventricosum TaxID=4639 RepID=A0AAV8PNA9_ENSVE|nr:hypothetical protein OPV22_033765 [Ensete ventricosum]